MLLFSYQTLLALLSIKKADGEPNTHLCVSTGCTHGKSNLLACKIGYYHQLIWKLPYIFQWLKF